MTTAAIMPTTRLSQPSSYALVANMRNYSFMVLALLIFVTLAVAIEDPVPTLDADAAVVTDSADLDYYRFNPSPLDNTMNIPTSIVNLLSEAQQNTPPIPSLFHFVIPETFSFANYLSIYSIHKSYTNGTIYCLIMNMIQPTSQWWSLTSPLCSQLLPVRNPQHIFGRPIRTDLTKSVVLRLEALLKYGGVAVDSDLIALHPLVESNSASQQAAKDDKEDKQLFMNDFIVIQQREPALTYDTLISTAFIAARPQSKLLQEWFAAYRVWQEPSETSIILAEHNKLLQQLALLRPHLFSGLKSEVMAKPMLDEKGLTTFYTADMPTTLDAALYSKQKFIHLQQNEIQVIPSSQKIVDAFSINTWEDLCFLKTEYGEVLRLALAIINPAELESHCPRSTSSQ